MKWMLEFRAIFEACRHGALLTVVASIGLAPLPVAGAEAIDDLFAGATDPAIEISYSAAKSVHEVACGKSSSVAVHVPAYDQMVFPLRGLERQAYLSGHPSTPPSNDDWDRECESRNGKDYELNERELDRSKQGAKEQCQKAAREVLRNNTVSCKVPSDARACDRGSCLPFPDLHFDPCEEAEARGIGTKVKAYGDVKQSSYDQDSALWMRECAVYAVSPALSLDVSIGCTECDQSDQGESGSVGEDAIVVD